LLGAKRGPRAERSSRGGPISSRNFKEGLTVLLRVTSTRHTAAPARGPGRGHTTRLGRGGDREKIGHNYFTAASWFDVGADSNHHDRGCQRDRKGGRESGPARAGSIEIKVRSSASLGHPASRAVTRGARGTFKGITGKPDRAVWWKRQYRLIEEAATVRADQTKAGRVAGKLKIHSFRVFSHKGKTNSQGACAGAPKVAPAAAILPAGTRFQTLAGGAVGVHRGAVRSARGRAHPSFTMRHVPHSGRAPGAPQPSNEQSSSESRTSGRNGVGKIKKRRPALKTPRARRVDSPGGWAAQYPRVSRFRRSRDGTEGVAVAFSEFFQYGLAHEGFGDDGDKTKGAGH